MAEGMEEGQADSGSDGVEDDSAGFGDHGQVAANQMVSDDDADSNDGGVALPWDTREEK